jgi:hypothetical protein
VREEQIGWVVEPGAVDRTVQVLQAAKENRSQLLAMGVRARQAVQAKYQRVTILSQFDAAVRDRSASLRGSEIPCQQ